MTGLFSIAFFLLPFVLIGGLIAAVVAARRRDEDEPDEEPGIGTVRRLFLYWLAFVALIFAAAGVSLLMGGALDAIRGETVIADSDTELAVGLAFVVVGAPAWLIFAWLAQRSVGEHPVERRSQARRLYLGLVRGVALVIVMVNAVAIGRMVLAVEDFEGGPWGWALTWGGVWLLHARVAAGELPPTASTRLFERLYLYFAALAGLYVLAGGLTAALSSTLLAAYDGAFRPALVVEAWSEGLRTAVAVTATGTAVWLWHWLREARHDAASTLWRVHIFLFGILGGMAMAIGGAAVLLHAVLQWFVGEPDAGSAAAHFARLPAAASVLAVGTASWLYHRLVLSDATAAEAAERSEPERMHDYVAATAGLLTLAAGTATLLAVTVDALTPADGQLLREPGWWRNPLVLGATLLIVGAPLWGRYWFQIQRTLAAAGGRERPALSRRIFLFAVLGVAVLTVLINLTILLFQIFEAVLEGDVTQAVIDDTRWSIALLLTAAAISVYYWLVLREDQRALAEGAPVRAAPRKEVVLLVGGPADSLVRELEQSDGVHVRVWRRLDQAGELAQLTGDELAALRAQIEAAGSERVVVIVVGGGFELVPYAVGPG